MSFALQTARVCEYEYRIPLHIISECSVAGLIAEDLYPYSHPVEKITFNSILVSQILVNDRNGRRLDWQMYFGRNFPAKLAQPRPFGGVT